MKFLIALFAFSLSFQAFGAPTNVRVLSGASRVVGEPITQVWGAMVGVADNSQTSPYDNCNELSDGGESFSGCNPLRVNGNTSVTIEFTEPDTLEQSLAPVAIVRQGGTGTGDVQPIPIGQINQQNARTGANQTGTLSFTWEDLCIILVAADGSKGRINSAAAGVNRCEDASGNPISGAIQVTYGFQTAPGVHNTNSTTILNFYLYSGPIPTDGDFATSNIGIMPQGCTASDGRYGFCDITFFPGDGGATVNPPEGFTERMNQLLGGPTVNINVRDPFAGDGANLPIGIEKLRVYLSSNTWNDAHPTTGDQFVEVLLDAPNSTTSPVFRDDSFGGLENGVAFLLRPATVDSSGSITHLFGDNFCSNGAAATPADCPDYAITPSEIAGLITESSCFITSATYGSPQAHQVTLFRQFRAKYMWPNKVGRFIARTYNKYGPVGAKWIYQNPSSKKYVRLGLYPFYGFAYLSVHFGFIVATLIYLLSLVVLALGLRKAFSKGKIS